MEHTDSSWLGVSPSPDPLHRRMKLRQLNGPFAIAAKLNLSWLAHSVLSLGTTRQTQHTVLTTYVSSAAPLFARHVHKFLRMKSVPMLTPTIRRKILLYLLTRATKSALINILAVIFFFCKLYISFFCPITCWVLNWCCFLPFFLLLSFFLKKLPF